MTLFESINGLAVLAAASSALLLAGLWYGPLFGQPAERLSNAEHAETPGRWRPLWGTFLLQIAAAAVLAMFVGPDAGLAFGTWFGFSAGFFWVGTALGVVYLFERRSVTHWAVNAGYQVLAFTLMGAILGAW
ncbi:MAG: DUF1761 domain-containing protein [Gemmatimonadota bacterium]